jgi:hypothetical protein
MKRVPEITVDDWLKAEEEVRIKGEAKPKGSITVEEYSKMRQLSPSRSQTILNIMCKAGVARCERWANGTNGCRKVYWLVKK